MADLVLKRNDTYTSITATITDSTGAVVNLTGASVTFVMRQLTAVGPSTNAAATIVSPSAGTVSYTFVAADTAVAGQYMAEWHVTTSGGLKLTYPQDGWLSIAIEEDLVTPSTGARLVSVAEVKDHLRIAATDRSHDRRLEEMIDAVAPVVENITGPVLVRKYQNETYDGGQPFITLMHPPVISVEQVVEYRGPVPYNLTQVPTPDLGTIYSYMFEPPGRLVRRTVGGGMTPFPPGYDQVFVSYTAGYPVTPSNIREGTLELLRVHFQRTEMARRPTFDASNAPNEDGVPTAPPIGFLVPEKVRELLMPSARRPSVA